MKPKHNEARLSLSAFKASSDFGFDSHAWNCVLQTLCSSSPFKGLIKDAPKNSIADLELVLKDVKQHKSFSKGKTDKISDTYNNVVGNGNVSNTNFTLPSEEITLLNKISTCLPEDNNGLEEVGVQSLGEGPYVTENGNENMQKCSQNICEIMLNVLPVTEKDNEIMLDFPSVTENCIEILQGGSKNDNDDAKKKCSQAKKSLSCSAGIDPLDCVVTRRKSTKKNDIMSVSDRDGKCRKKTMIQNEVETLEMEGNYNCSEENIKEKVNNASNLNGRIEVKSTALPRANIEASTVPNTCPEVWKKKHEDHGGTVEEENVNPSELKFEAELMSNAYRRRHHTSASQTRYLQSNSESENEELFSSRCTNRKRKRKSVGKKNPPIRIRWKQHEEEAFKNAMYHIPSGEFFSCATKWERGETIPWTKIFNAIRHRLENHREAKDLYDKWRNIINKEAREKKKKEANEEEK